MKARWKQLSARFAALSKRERLMLPAAVGLGIVMLSYLLVVDPARKQSRLLQQQAQQEASDLAVLQAQITVLRAKAQDPDAPLRLQLEALRGQTRAADDRFKQLQQSLVPAQEISQWLGGLLKAQRGLQLTGLRSLPAVSVNDLLAPKPPAGAASAVAAAPAASAAESAPAKDAWLYRHGVEITLRGSYGDLVSYLNALEHMPRRVYWGELKINAQESPATVMTLTVYTISLEKTWWVI